MREQPTARPVADGVPSRRPSTGRATAQTAAILAAFALYTAFLLKLLLFSRSVGSERWVNLVPFATIAHYAFGHSSDDGRTAFANLVGNVLVFIPLGAYLSWFRRRSSAWTTVLTVASVSVAVEVVQGVLAIGASDIDDVILNSVGGLSGVLALRLLAMSLRDRSRVRAALAVLSLLTVPVWVYLLVGVRLHL